MYFVIWVIIFFKYEKECRIYKKIKPDNSISYIKVNMKTCKISKKDCIYNNLNTEELIACKYIMERELIERINELGE